MARFVEMKGLLTLLAGLLLLFGSLCFLGWAGAAPVKSAPALPVAAQPGSGIRNPIAVQMALYQRMLSEFASYQRDLILSGALAAAASLLLLFATGGFVAVFSLSLASAWSFLCYLQVAQSNLGLILFRVPFPFSVGWFHPAMMEGELAFSFFACACLGLLLACDQFGLGWLRSVQTALAVFAVPGVLFFEGGLAVLLPSQMPQFVVTHATWRWGAGYLLSNWNVLYSAMATGALTYGSVAFGLVRWRRDRKASRDQGEFAQAVINRS